MSTSIEPHPQQGGFALVDCNNFFCSCERVFDPSLTGKPLVVLSNNDGCIISRSQEAKALGIPMGAPLHEHRDVIRRHDVRVFSSNYTLYGDMSARVMSVLRDAVPEMEVYSIDEAFLALHPSFGEAAARELRARVLRWTGIPVCIGIGSTKLLAKVANRHAKKHPECGGAFDLTAHPHPEDILEAVGCLDLWGVGKRLSARLERMGIRTALEFRNADPAAVRRSLGVVGERLARELGGISCLALEAEAADRKGVMASRSFGSPMESLSGIEEALANHAARAAERIRRGSLLATRVEVFLQTNRFSKDDPQHCPVARRSLSHPTASTSKLIAEALALLRTIHRPGHLYKKTGILLTELVSRSSFQPSLPMEPITPGSGIDIDAIVDAINARMGDPLHPVITRGAMGTERSKNAWRMKSDRRSRCYTTSLKDLPVAHA